MNYKILIAEDHPMTLKGLRLLVEHHAGKAMIREAGSCRQLMKELSANSFSHLILDIMLADGSALEVIPTIRNLYPELEIMVFSGQPANLYRRALVRYRIGYVLSKGMQEKETLELLRQFLNNEQRIDGAVNRSQFATRIRQETSGQEASIPFAGMPAREIDVLQYLLKGWRTSQIAETLNLSVSTISTLKSRIFERTQTSNIKELMDLAMIHQVITL
jgi:two-component system, NarL family, invasion response regulator UvrY